MAIAYENTATSSGIGFGPTQTLTINAGTNADRCIVVFAFTDRGGATTISSATYNSNSMTAWTAFTSGTTGFDGRIFYIAGANATSGSNTVQVTFSDGNTKNGLIAVAYSGVDGTTPLSGEATNSGFGTNSSWNVTSAVGETVIALATLSGGGAVTGGTGTTVKSNPTVGTFTCEALEEAGGATVTINATWTGNAEWWGVGASLKPVSAGSGNTIAVPAGSLSLSGLAPTIGLTANQSVAVPAGSLSLTANAPTVTATANNTVSVAAGSLTLTGFAPDVLGGTSTPALDVGRGRHIPRATIIRYKGEEYIAESDAEAEAWIKTIREHELKKLEQSKQAKRPKPVPKPAEFKIQAAPQQVRDYAAEAQQLMQERYEEALRFAAEQKKAYEKWLADDDEDVFALVRMIDV